MLSKLDSLRMMIRLSTAPATVMVLAKELDLPAATASRAVSTLERLGWVGRTRSNDDRRYVQVGLTSAAQDTLKRAGLNAEGLKMLGTLMRALESTPGGPPPLGLEPDVTAPYPVISQPAFA